MTHLLVGASVAVEIGGISLRTEARLEEINSIEEALLSDHGEEVGALRVQLVEVTLFHSQFHSHSQYFGNHLSWLQIVGIKQDALRGDLRLVDSGAISQEASEEDEERIITDRYVFSFTYHLTNSLKAQKSLL